MEIKRYLNTTYQCYYALKKKAEVLRETSLKDLAATKVKANGGDQDNIFKKPIKP